MSQTLFNLDMVKGILLAIGRPELTIYQNEKKDIGYEIRIRINIRADSERFLEEINIRCKVKYHEGKHRPKPILWISGIRNIISVCNLIEELVSSKTDWAKFSDAANIIYEGLHNTQEGLDRLLKLKGAIL